VLELSGSPAAFESAFPLTRLGGCIALVGALFPAAPVPLAMDAVVRRNLRLTGVHNYAPRDLKAAVHFLAGDPQYPFDALVDGWFPLACADAAFAAARNADAIRIGIRPG